MVFWTGKPSRTHADMMMDELTQSYDHLKMAAGHMAGGAAEKVTPPYDRARNTAARGWKATRSAFSPLYEQMRDGAANARTAYPEAKRNRWPMLFGLLAAGAAVGAAGAVVVRRRRAMSEWDEYEPLGGVDTGYGMGEGKATTKKLAEGAASVAGSVSVGAGRIADSLHGRSGRAPDVMGDVAQGAGDTAGSAKENTQEQARKNSRP